MQTSAGESLPSYCQVQYILRKIAEKHDKGKIYNLVQFKGVTYVIDIVSLSQIIDLFIFSPSLSETHNRNFIMPQHEKNTPMRHFFIQYS